MSSGTTPHVGGPILGPGALGVSINEKYVALVGDLCTCCGPPDSIVQGAAGVLINGVPIALQGSLTAHGGQVVEGVPGVMVSPASKSIEAVALEEIAANKTITERTDTNGPELFTGCSENPLVERNDADEIEASEEYALKSDFAHRQLMVLADDIGEMNFIAFMIRTFGRKISISSYSKLYRALSDKKVENPKIEVTKNRIAGGLAAFDKNREIIYVSESLLKSAIEDNDKRGMLLTALTEEYGHYIDRLLRTSFAESDKPDTDYIDAGAVYAYNLFFLDTFEKAVFHFADTESPEYSGPLKLDLTEIHTALTEYVAEEEQWDTERHPDRDSFGAGRVDRDKYKDAVGHQDILDEVIDFDNGFFNEEEGLKIYYGNWLRDFSQVILGSSVRLTTATQQELKKRYPKNEYLKNLMQSSVAKLSPEGMVRLVHIAAIKEFEYEVQKEIAGRKETFDHGFIQNEANFNDRFGKLTPEILGGYRPEEHIDNPKNLVDESMLYQWQYGDRDITLYKGGYDDHGNYLGGGKDPLLQIDLKHGLKDYIINDRGPGKQSARSYMLGQLKEAMAAGRTTKGLRHFGAALHVLEDYFAHTNFVEVSLIKVGYPKTYPWVKHVAQTGFAVQGDHTAASLIADGKAVVKRPYYANGGEFRALAKHIPIVTGIFGLDDSSASVLPKLAHTLFPTDFEAYRKPKPGERTFTQMGILELLKDLAKGQKADGAKKTATYMGKTFAAWLALYEKYLVYLDYKATKIQEGDIGGTLWEYHDRFMKSMGDQLSWFANFAFNLLLHGTNEETADHQTLYTNKNYGTDPTHTQIAKDPPEHHFNPLAGLLAKHAVRAVAEKIILYWKERRPAQQENVLATAAGFFVHPVKCQWQDAMVSDWAKKNPEKMLRGEDSTTIAHTHKQAKRKMGEFDDIYQDILEYFSKE